jgi:hypothetical protein
MPIGGIGVQLMRAGLDSPTHRCCQETASFVTDRSTRALGRRNCRPRAAARALNVTLCD